MSLEQVSSIYDHLFAFEKDKGKGGAYPIHKPLDFPLEQKSLGIADISDLVLAFLPKRRKAHVLDAGCGVGYTLQKICTNPLYSGLGISLSQQELALARASVHQSGLSDRCSFKKLDFDQEFDQKFDLILCMESIKHSPDWRKSLGNLLKHLHADGAILLIEDFYQGNTLNEEEKRFQEVWAVPDLFSYQDVCSYMNERGVKLEQEKILDEYIRKHRAWKSKLSAQFCKISTPLFSLLPAKKQLLQIYEGALLMDYLYAKSLFSYRLLYFQAPSRRFGNR
ncbi:MAG: methyltransferase domain-containing protein [Bacteroidota bacterium]